MTPDGTNSFSTASESFCTPEGTHVTEQDAKTGSEVKIYPNPEAQTWSYLFVHHSKIKGLEFQLTKDQKTFFVHKTVRYFKKNGKQGVHRQEVPTVSGLIFFKGNPKEIQSYLDLYFPNAHLCKNCSTGRVAQIPDAQMRPFMRINVTSPDRIRFLLRPFHYYATNHILLRITSGELAGLEGYVIRIDRDRRLVMDVGGISVAISGVHAEKFEEVEPAEANQSDPTPFYKRNLQEREAIIDRYFHPVKTTSEVAAQAENIDYLRNYVLAEIAQSRITLAEAWTTYTFIIKEIGYYYAPFVDQFPDVLAPILQQGTKVLHELATLLAESDIEQDLKERYTTDHQELITKYGYLFSLS